MTPTEIVRRLAEVAKRIAANRRRIGSLRRRAAWLRQQLAKVRRPTTMYDSIDVGQIPSNARAVAGYVGGRWPTFAALAQAFPHAQRLSIAISASESAACLDIEQGDARPEQAAEWVRWQLGNRQVRPVLYASASQIDAILASLEAAGIHRSQVRFWSAHYGHGRHLCGPATCGEVRSTSVDATQYDDHALGRNLDVSVLRRSFFA